MEFSPPTSQLPSIRSIASSSPENLLECVEYIYKIYCPPVRGSQKRRNTVHEEEDLDVIRSDAFERSYAIKWLTALVSRAGCDGDEIVTKHAASLLAICAGTASAGIFTRTFTFGTAHVQLRDVPLENHDYGSVGAQTWGGACVLADIIAECPHEFVWENIRVLELGAGTGLVSLVLAKLLQSTSAEIVATDFYPSVLTNLESNVSLNIPSAGPVSVVAKFLDWSEVASSKDKALLPPFNKPFDLIIGADIVYEAQHARWIKSCLERFLPHHPLSESHPQPLFHLVIPLRSTHVQESSTIEDVFQLSSKVETGGTLGILSKQTIVCDEFEKDGDDVEYAYYKIGRC